MQMLFTPGTTWLWAYELVWCFLFHALKTLDLCSQALTSLAVFMDGWQPLVRLLIRAQLDPESGIRRRLSCLINR